ncbi:MAG: type II secretion system protein N [Arenicella sp.]
MSFTMNPKYYVLSVVALALMSLLLFTSLAYSQFLDVKEASVSVEDRLSNGQTVEKGVSSGSLDYNMNRIRSAKLFAVKKKPQKKTIKAKKTQLRLKLDGIVAAKQEGMSRAVIKSKNKRSLTYSVGDKIQGTNAKLHSVEAGRVLIDRAGVLESLELERKKVEL